MVSEWIVGARDIGNLVSRMFDSSRDGALVVVSPASDTNRPRIDTQDLAALLPPGTELAVLETMTASERLSDAVDTQFQAYGGGIRVILAGASRTDHWRRHRLFRVYPGDDQHQACKAIAQFVESHPGVGGPRQIGASSPTSVLSANQLEILSKFKQKLPGTTPVVPAPKPSAKPRPLPKPGPFPTPASAPSPIPVALPDAVTSTELKRLFAAQTEAITKQVRGAILDDLIQLIDNEQASLARERSRADSAEEELDQLRRRMAEQEEQQGYPTVYRDAEKQFRWEVQHEWLTSVPEEERAQAPLNPYVISEVFLKSLDSDLLRSRRRVIRIIVDILSGHAWDRQKTHQYIIPPKAAAQRIVPDGVTPWRTNVKTGAPGAPRLTWWQLTDGTIELNHIGHHDDMLR